MGNITVDIMPPSYWQDFEKLTLDYAKLVWSDDYACRNGRQGQLQAGVDVYGYNYNKKEHTGIQCKKRIWKTKVGADSPSNTLTTKEIDDELKAAKAFYPPLDRFIIATSGLRDVDLQAHVRLLNSSNTKPLIEIMFWEDFVDFFNDNPDFMYRYYENVLMYRDRYSPDEHYYRLLAMAFNRPAIRTEFHLENRVTDFINAISATQNAISTGCLKDSNGNIIDQARVPKSKPANLRKAERNLSKVRDLATSALKRGEIIEHETVIEIKNPSLIIELNKLRFEAVELLNTTLTSANLPIVHIS
ncbi:hypothetical protein [Acinetobacter bereziniae]|uniref:hypothetical protein n=1 Tax=Acinetobacter bereziniae TaxID=106648 RepID=UPI003008DFA5